MEQVKHFSAILSVVAQTPEAPGAAERHLVTQLTRQMMAVSIWTGRYHDARFEELGLTPAATRALLQLDPATPMPTRYLAERLSCDPSNVTAFVDQLEDAGMIERRVDRGDRRVKTLVMTDRGRQVREQMITMIVADSPSLQRLTTDEQRTLLFLLDKAWAACEEHDTHARRRPALR